MWKLFGQIVRSDSDEDHVRALNEPPKDWRRPRGRPRQTHRRAGPPTTKHRAVAVRHSAQDRAHWRQVIETATLQQGLVYDDEDKLQKSETNDFNEHFYMPMSLDFQH